MASRAESQEVKAALGGGGGGGGEARVSLLSAVLMTIALSFHSLLEVIPPSSTANEVTARRAQHHASLMNSRPTYSAWLGASCR